MKLNNLLEAKYQGKKTWVVQVFDPEEGVLDVYGGPFNSKEEAGRFADHLETTIKDVLVKAGGENEFGRFMWDDIPRFHPVEVDSPDSFRHTMIDSVERQFSLN